MRLVILSDIHGNPIALDAVQADIQSQGEVDAYWVLGDFAALGYDPVTPLENITALPHASFTRGNTDRYVVTGDLPVPPEKALQDPTLLPEIIEAVRSFSWTRGYLSAAGWLDWLMNVPLEVRLTLPDGTRLLGVHASPGRDDGPVSSPSTAMTNWSNGWLAARQTWSSSGIPMFRSIVGLAGNMSSIWAASVIRSRQASRRPMCFWMPTSMATTYSCGAWITTARQLSKLSSTHVIPPPPS